MVFRVENFGRYQAFWVAANEHGSGRLYTYSSFNSGYPPNPNKADGGGDIVTNRTPQCELTDDCRKGGGGGGPTSPSIPPSFSPQPSDGPFFVIGKGSLTRSRLRSIGRQQSDEFLDFASEFLSEVYERDLNLRGSFAKSGGRSSHALALAYDLRSEAIALDRRASSGSDISWTRLLDDMVSYYRSGSGISKSQNPPHDLSPSEMGGRLDDSSLSDSKALSVSVFPNPTLGFINVEIGNDAAADALIEIHDILGRTVHRQTLRIQEGNLTYQVNLSEVTYNLTPGWYVARVRQGDHSASKSFLIR